MSSGAYVPPHRRNKQPSNPANNPITTTASGSSERQYNQRWRKDKQDASDALLSQELAEKFTRICCINLKQRPDRLRRFGSRMKSALGDKGALFIEKVERFDAVDGAEIMAQGMEEMIADELLPRVDWDASKNALYDRHIQPPMTKQMTAGEVGCAMSHARLWKQVADSKEEECIMLILEDDAQFYKGKQQGSSSRHDDSGSTRKQGTFGTDRRHNRTTPGFPEALSSTWQLLPSDWDILYLGFSDRGERHYVQSKQEAEKDMPIQIQLFRPTYGFHTHAYALTKHAASTLLKNLPISGPVDVWLADNEWFGLNVYCSVVANEGWQGLGANLVAQLKHPSSNIQQSGRGE